MKNILVTGGAGFIGSNLIKRLFADLKDATIVNIDNMNAYYDVSLKEYRLKELETLVPEGINYKFVKGSIADKALVDKLFEDYKFDVVVNFAAQAGVRYSIENPDVYIESNIIGFYNILEACRHSLTPSPSPEGMGGLPRRSAFGVCQFKFCVWRQQEGAVCGGGQGGQPRFALCSHQEEQRAVCPLLQQIV